MPHSIISLIGMPGSGKTTLGKHLAHHLGCSFLDSDAVIEEYVGCSIRDFFAQHGEAHFREIEAEVIQKILEEKNLVLATGGGSILMEANRRTLRKRSTIIYLRAAPQDILRRLGKDTKRPLLQVEHPLKKLEALHATRHPLYSALAHFTVDTGKPSLPLLLQRISSFLELDVRASFSFPTHP